MQITFIIYSIDQTNKNHNEPITICVCTTNLTSIGQKLKHVVTDVIKQLDGDAYSHSAPTLSSISISQQWYKWIQEQDNFFDIVLKKKHLIVKLLLKY